MTGKVGSLISHDRFVDRLRIGPSEYDLVPISVQESAELPLLGHFAYVNERRVLLYKWDGQLKVQVGNDPPLDLLATEMTWTCQNDQVLFTLSHLGRPAIVFQYPLSNSIVRMRDGFDPTHAEPEDFDFPLFLKNIRYSPERIALFKG